jgi:hypothetical protein
MTDETTIPKPRFDAVLARAKEAEAALAALQGQHAELSNNAKAWQRDAEIATELRAERDALTAQLQDQRQTGDAHLAMVSAGVTDSEVRDYALHRYSQQVGTEGAQDWGDWWSAQQQAPSAVLRPFLQPAEAPSAPQQLGTTGEVPTLSPEPAPVAVAPTPVPAPVVPQSNAGTMPTPAAAQAYTPGSIASLPPAARKAALADALNGSGGWPFN